MSQKDGMRDLQLLIVGMYLADPKRTGEDVNPDDFADPKCSNLVSILRYETFGKSEKQDAIRNFIGDALGIEVHNETWREEIFGMLRVNGMYGGLINRMAELYNFDTDTKEGQLAFVKHFKNLADQYINKG